MGGTLGNQGSVSYQFSQKGLITVKKNGKSLDDIFLLAADMGAEDVEEAGEEVLVYTRPEDLGKIKDSLSEAVTVSHAELIRKPTVTVSLEDKLTADRVLSFIDRLESLDDVQKVYANFDIPESFIT